MILMKYQALFLWKNTKKKQKKKIENGICYSCDYIYIYSALRVNPFITADQNK